MIEVKGLTRYYGDFPAVRDVSFNVGENMIVGFLGLNGAGKSTVLKVLAGLLMPSAGVVRINGVDVLEAPDSARAAIGYLPEEPPLYKEMRVNDFLRWCGQIRGMSKGDVDKRLPEVLKICQLTHVADRVIHELSHGYKKRVGIAQAIIHRPKLVILDEPISGLDPVQIVEMREVLKALKTTCTVLVSSHILSEISQTCDRLMVLHDGKIVAEGSETELRDRLRGKLAVEFILRGEQEVVESVLSGHPGLDNHSVRAENDLIFAHVEFSGDAREDLAKAFVEKGLGLRGMADHSSSELESVFIGLTRETPDMPKPEEVEAA